MCDYHSISVNRRGTIAHVAKNSHFIAVEKFQWKENTEIRTHYWDFEYNPEDGDYPGALKCMTGDGYVSDPTQRTLDSADIHYERLANLHSGDYSLLDTYFSGEEYTDVKWHIASNPSTPPKILTKLYENKDYLVTKKIASNPSTPPEILTKLREDKRGNIQVQIARNPSTPQEIIAELSNELSRNEDCIIRKMVAHNPSTPPKILTQLGKDNSPIVRKAAHRNPNFYKLTS